MGTREYDKAVELMSHYPTLMQFVGPRSEELIQSAEDRLEVQFPGSYRSFILNFGAGSFGSFEVYGVINDNFEKSTIPNGIWATLDAQKRFNLPAKLVIIGSDGMGDDYVLDLRRQSQTYLSVIIYSVGLQEREQDIEVMAPDFGSFLYSKVKEQIEIHRAR